MLGIHVAMSNWAGSVYLGAHRCTESYGTGRNHLRGDVDGDRKKVSQNQASKEDGKDGAFEV